MKRFAVLIATLTLLAGCKSAPPSLNAFSPFSKTTVPPPGTGAYGKPDAYYQPSPAAGSPGGAIGSGITGASTAPSSPGSGVTDNPLTVSTRTISSAADLAKSGTSNTPSVRLASVEREVGSEPPIRIVESGERTNGLKTSIKGMPVNDVTQASEPTEPRRIDPPEDARDLSKFPRPPATRSGQSVPLQSIGPPPTPRVEVKPDSSSSAQSAPLKWKPRSDTDAEVRLADR